MTWDELLFTAWTSLRVHLLRSSLTVLGIAIAVAAIVGVSSVLSALTRVVTQELESVGAAHLAVLPWDQPEASARSGSGRLTWSDGRALKDQIEGLEVVTPLVAGQGTASAGEREHRPSLIGGVRPDWLEVDDSDVAVGRFLVPLDLERHRKVAVLGSTVVSELGLGRAPIGQRIEIAGLSVEVVGILAERGRSLLGNDSDDVVLIPFETAVQLFGRRSGERVQLRIRLGDSSRVESARSEIARLLRARHGLGESEGDGFRVLVPDRFLSTFRSVLRSLTFAAVAVIAVALLVGGVGIMNIMLVTVTERTHEIGLRKSVGASRVDIFRQFLVEAVLVSWLGALFGIVAGSSLAAVLTWLLSWVLPSGGPGLIVPGWTLLLATGFCTLVGLVFGIYPASKAAALEPVEALRHS